jgi:hypothetical protein
MLRAQDVDHFGHLCLVALTSRDRFLKASEFLLSRPDLLDALRTLTVFDGWSRASLRNTLADSFNIQSLPNFYPIIQHHLNQVAEATKNLTTLRLTCINIWPTFLAAISRIETLHTIMFLACQLDNDTCESILENQIRLQESILNVELNLIGDDSIWYTLCLYPRICTLSIMGPMNEFTFLPAHDILDRLNPFKTLERVSLSNFDPNDMLVLSAWIVKASENVAIPDLKLTHFKVHTRLGIANSALSDLLRALRLSPNLQVLVLEGLAGGGLDIIDSIAEACPNLLGLTLIRRHNDRQTSTKLALWPHTSAEYASRFPAFSRLRYFAWNFRVENFLDPTPAIMTQFENGFPELHTPKGWQEQDEADQIAYFQDAHLIAGSFAAHCPTLKTFAIVERVVHLACRIERLLDGRFQLFETDDIFSHSVRMWNTKRVSGWPPVLPPTKMVSIQ